MIQNNENSMLKNAMVLSAGLGTRMRPLTDNLPKPLIEVEGRSLLDHNLDNLERAGIKNTVVNIHYLGEQIINHISDKSGTKIQISDERDLLLDSGGGIKAALPLLGENPFYILNSDSFWIDRKQNTLEEMANEWQRLNHKADVLLLLSSKENAVGFDGPGDFFLKPDGRLERRGDEALAPYIYAGCAVMRPEIFATTNEQKFSLNLQFNEAIAKGRLYGIVLDGLWLHVGTPQAIALSEKAIAHERGNHG